MARGRAVPRSRAPRRDGVDPLAPVAARSPELGRLVPSARSLAVAAGAVVLVVCSWLVAHESSLFGIRTVQVDDATPAVATQVRRALAAEVGQSLLQVDVAAAERALEQLPTVESAAIDRAFPHELRVSVVPERAVALVRQGRLSAVVSARGRVMRRVGDPAARPELPRIWAPRRVDLSPGSFVEGDVAVALRAVTPLAGGRFPGRVGAVRTTRGELTLRLRSGLEIRLGDAADADLKLAVARRVIPLLDAGTRLLDVSVPERPVASFNTEPQVEIDTTSSETTGEIR